LFGLGGSWEVVGAEAHFGEDAVDFGLEAVLEVGLGGCDEIVVGQVGAGEGVGETGDEGGGGVEVEVAGSVGTVDLVDGSAQLALLAG
jgi:hypothetical protein